MAELPVMCGCEAAHSAELNPPPPYGVLRFKCFFPNQTFFPYQAKGLACGNVSKMTYFVSSVT